MIALLAAGVVIAWGLFWSIVTLEAWPETSGTVTALTLGLLVLTSGLLTWWFGRIGWSGSRADYATTGDLLMALATPLAGLAGLLALVFGAEDHMGFLSRFGQAVLIGVILRGLSDRRPVARPPARLADLGQPPGETPRM